MIFRTSYRGLFFLLAASPYAASSANLGNNNNNNNNNNGRRLVSPGQSIADEVRASQSEGRGNGGGNGGNNKPKAGGHGQAKFRLQGNTDGGTFEINVRESIPAITGTTTYSVNGGASQLVKAAGIDTFLVTDTEEERDGGMAIIAVNTRTNLVNGIIQKGGSDTKFTQTPGNPSMVYNAPNFTPPEWNCGNSKEQEVNTSDSERTSRHLFEDHDHDEHHHDEHHHDEHHHDEHHHDEHHNHEEHDHGHEDHDHDHLDLSAIKESLRGSTMRIGKPRKLQGGDAAGYSRQVDIYLEIDYDFCEANEDIDCGSAGPGQNTLNYISAIFAGANTIYEEEIDTHLNVIHIDLNNNYANASGSSNALAIMRNIYAQSSTWHHEGTDLHHALLGRPLGGGVAYRGTICNSNWGFGLSGNINGNYNSMDSSVVWDMTVFMHELGHNFGSGHTHDVEAYTPVIDTCGISCPSGLPLVESATIMSYCHICNGGNSNLDYTFGGKYIGTGSRTDVNNYIDSPLTGSISSDARRVTATMASYIASTSCTAVPTGPTPSPTPWPTPVATPPPTLGPTPAPTPCPGDSSMLVTIDILTDNYGGETSWTLTNTCSGIEVEADSGYANNSPYSSTRCLPGPARYAFTIADSFGDGICCGYGNGSYDITVDGNPLVVDGGEFTFSETTTFGECPTTPTTPPPTPGSTPTTPPPTTADPTPVPTPNPTTADPTPVPTPNPTTADPTPAPTPNPTTADPTPVPTPNPTTADPTPAPTPNPTTADPTPSPTPNPTGADPPPSDCVDIAVEIQLDMHPDQTSWTLANGCTGETVITGPMVKLPQALYSGTFCLPPSEYQFVIKDSIGDGLGSGSYTVTSGGGVVASGAGDFGNSASHTLPGDC